MAKLFILYTLKDDVTEEAFEQWVNEYKGPFMNSLSAVKRYTLTKSVGAEKAQGGRPPASVPLPYQYAAMVDISSFEEYQKNAESREYREVFMPTFANKVKDFLLLQSNEVFEK